MIGEPPETTDRTLSTEQSGMTCREFVEFLMRYLSGELPEAARSIFEKHLAECPDCVAYLKTYQQTIQLGHAAFTDPKGLIPNAVPEELVRAILAANGLVQ